MSLLPFSYEAHEVRVLSIDGEPWFVLADLTKVLGLSQFRKDRLDDGVIQNHPIQDRLGRTQNATIVSEAGMYEVVIRSDKPDAAKFRRWITTEVLPSIRKTGSYSVAPALTEDQIIHQALQITAKRVEQLETEVKQLTPKAASFDHFLSATGDYSVSQAAQMLVRAGATTGRNRLFGDMETFRWVYKPGGSRFWNAYQRVVDAGCLTVRAGKYEDQHTGVVHPTSTIRITPKGLFKLAEKFGVVLTEEHINEAA